MALSSARDQPWLKSAQSRPFGWCLRFGSVRLDKDDKISRLETKLVELDHAKPKPAPDFSRALFMIFAITVMRLFRRADPFRFFLKHPQPASRRPSMYFAAAVLTVLAGLFYAAGNHEIGSYSSDVCRYGSTFCDNPHYVLVGAGLAAVWGAFVSIK
jgi:hypothetical protein